ncbi:unnamed protein product, partial [Trichogramma brassicae]
MNPDRESEPHNQNNDRFVRRCESPRLGQAPTRTTPRDEHCGTVVDPCISPAFLNYGRHPRPVKSLHREVETPAVEYWEIDENRVARPYFATRCNSRPRENFTWTRRTRDKLVIITAVAKTLDSPKATSLCDARITYQSARTALIKSS